MIPLEPQDYDRWLTGTLQEVGAMLRPPALEIIEAGPVTLS